MVWGYETCVCVCFLCVSIRAYVYVEYVK